MEWKPIDEIALPPIPLAIKALTKALKEDPDYFYTWQANIAVDMQDEYTSEIKKRNLSPTIDIHEISNEAAKRFLNRLCYEPKDPED